MIDNEGPDLFAPIPPGWFEFGDELAWVLWGQNTNSRIGFCLRGKREQLIGK